MNPDPNCPVCGQQRWNSIGRREFSQRQYGSSPQARRERLRVLFELWLPGVEPVLIEDILCEQCGLVIFRPRPSAQDLEAKYRFLHRTPTAAPLQELTSVERNRSLELMTYLRANGIEANGARVLDYGGFRGALMHALIQSGATCHVVDYAPDALPGVSKLGSTLEDLRADDVFDLIVCSHVLEHVAEPREICAGLLRHLAPEGHLYVEVPMEIWGHAPMAREPVTHINFFSVPSLHATLELAGFRPTRIDMSPVTVGTGARHLVVQAFAQRANVDAQVAVEDRGHIVRKLVRASPLERALLHLRDGRLIWAARSGLERAVRHKVKRILRLTR